MCDSVYGMLNLLIEMVILVYFMSICDQGKHYLFGLLDYNFRPLSNRMHEE